MVMARRSCRRTGFHEERRRSVPAGPALLLAHLNLLSVQNDDTGIGAVLAGGGTLRPSPLEPRAR